jgi:hypothetical protein
MYLGQKLCHRAPLFYFIFLLETGSCCIAQSGLKLLGSNDPPASAASVAGTEGMYHCAWLTITLFLKIKLN